MVCNWGLSMDIMMLYMLAGDEDVSEDRSSNSNKDEKLCNHCNKKVLEYVVCIKCGENFHFSCMNQAAKRRNAICVHQMTQVSNVEEDNESGSCHAQAFQFMEINLKLEKVSAENILLKELLREVQEKNKILTENNNLLVQRLCDIDKKNAIAIAKKS
ncbi:hypothetical protein WA026_018589 [Henosepilachna vigintioctopunctata]|uniref:Uncharacterized protein n=1 Tax=Henosepilachna vigintioctopunctata TaxID=420089 RepID=A0AAW1U4T5_9CUCU